MLYLENPQEGQYISTLELLDDVTTMDYQGLKLSFQRRAASGVRLDGNWTWGRCLGGHIARGGGGAGDTGGGGIYDNPADLDYDRGHCDWDQTHLANFTRRVPDAAVRRRRAAGRSRRTGSCRGS